MKLTLALVFVALSIVVASAELSCITDENKCLEDECCVQISFLEGRCTKLKDEYDRCQMNPGKSSTKAHVYSWMCPCKSGMECAPLDGQENFGRCENVNR